MRNVARSRHFCALLAAVAPIGIASAQEAGSAASARAETSSSREAINEVVVTGSRIIRNGDDFPTPVTVVSTDQLTLASPANIPAALNKLPIFSGQNGQSLGLRSRTLSGNYLKSARIRRRANAH